MSKENYRKRKKAKRGYVYVLASKCGRYLKYGATTISAKSRVSYANKKAKSIFYVVGEYKTHDIYEAECRVKWTIWDTDFKDWDFDFGEEIIPSSFGLEKLCYIAKENAKRCYKLSNGEKYV